MYVMINEYCLVVLYFFCKIWRWDEHQWSIFFVDLLC